MTTSNQTMKPPITYTKWILVFGMATLAVALAAMLVLPAKAELAEGFFTPVVAFELARSPADLAFLTGADEQAQLMRTKMRQGLWVDALFPFCYAGFILLLLLQALRCFPIKNLPKNKEILMLTKVGVLLAVLLPFLDFAENYQMLHILNHLDKHTAPPDMLMQNLHFATWIKWLAIGLCFGLLAVHYAYAQVDYFSKRQHLLAILCAGGCFVITLLAFYSLSAVLGEMMGLSVVVALVYFFVANLVVYRRHKG